MKKHIIITIDGPSGVGKSSIAEKLSNILNIPYLNTGAMFRMLALLIGNKMDSITEEYLLEHAKEYTFQLKKINTSSILTFNNTPIPNSIYNEDTAKIAAQLALIPAIRKYVKNLQRNIGISTSLIAEGRDLGTEIFPNAQYKFFLNANIHVRAKRRFQQLKNTDSTPKLSNIIKDLKYRDTLDQDRVIAPLIPAHDAVIIDTSKLNLDETIEVMLTTVTSKKL